MKTNAFSIKATVGALLVLIFVSVLPGDSRDQTLTIDGQKIHIETLGVYLNTIVVFEAGLGNNSSTWRLVAGPVATFARVVLYDRAGLGQSLPMMTKNSGATAEEVVYYAPPAAGRGPTPSALYTGGATGWGNMSRSMLEKLP